MSENMIFSESPVGSVIKVQVLVVDDDSECLSFTANFLKAFHYQGKMIKMLIFFSFVFFMY